MATRSTIAVQHADESISVIYCHWDGYISNNGRILVDNYATLELAEELVINGLLSSLGKYTTPVGAHSFDNPEVDCCVYYGRDRSELDCEPNIYPSLADYLYMHQRQDYNYLFKDGAWWLMNHNRTDNELLADVLMNCLID
jgi:hypothetical protein